jgi:hypothetical protein
LFIFLAAVSGLAWSLVYVDAVRLGLRKKTYAMPLFALGLNFSWEIIYAVNSMTSGGGFQGIVDICWAILDAGIVYTYFRYGRQYWPKGFPRWTFLTWAILAFAASCILQLLFLREFGAHFGGGYSAFLQNLLMSILFINMLIVRRGTEGQSLLIAFSKWVGTLAPTISLGILAHNLFFFAVGALCCVFDIIYICLLFWVRKHPNVLVENLQPAAETRRLVEETGV